MTTERIDAAGQSLGRVATRAATMLRGKHRPDFSPQKLGTTTVIIENVSKLRFSGKKLDQKYYYRFSGYPGGLKSESLRSLFERAPDRVVRLAVRNMLPGNRLRDRLLKHLTITK